jgi:hypothetical protein
MAITIISYPNNEINESLATDATFDSRTIFQLAWINMEEITDDTYIEVVYNGQTITLLVETECKYTPTNIFFINKEGAEQNIQFFKEKRDTLTVTSNEFESDRGQPFFGNHQFVKFNVQGRTKFKVNSGFVKESNNEAFKQLFLSNRIWWLEDAGNLAQRPTAIPLNIESKSLEFKTRQKDRLINYEVEFSHAFQEINNI